MHYSPETATSIWGMIERHMATEEDASVKIKTLWSILIGARARALTNSIRQIAGDKVVGGPFKGMALTEAAATGNKSAILLGCYEHELHTTFEKIIATRYTRILNIGCSFGYYAAGLAFRMPDVRISAFDILPEARLQCADMARLNNVADRIEVGGEFKGEDFALYAQEKTLVLMDVEGAEKFLLDPEKFPTLRNMDVVVELHDVFDETLSQTICDRFRASHAVELILNRNILPDTSAILPSSHHLDPFDRLLLGWEDRDGMTPWGVFFKK